MKLARGGLILGSPPTLLGFAALLLQLVVGSHAFAQALFPLGMDTTPTTWDQENDCIEIPSCDECPCNATNAPYARTNSTTSSEWLTALQFDPANVPANRCVTEVVVDIMCRYDTDVTSRTIDWSYRIGNSGSWSPTRTSPAFNSASGTCQYRLGLSGNITNERDWNANPSDLDQIQVRVRKPGGFTSFTRVRTIGVFVTTRARAMPVSTASATPSIFCATQTGNITLQATGGFGDAVDWHAGSCDGPIVGTGSTITIPRPANTTTYFPRTRTTCGPSACSASATVTIVQSPTAPTNASVSNPTPCAGVGTITLTAVGGSGSLVEWRRSSCDGPVVGTGVSLVLPAPTLSTTYFAKWINSPCQPSSCASVVVQPRPSPVAPFSIGLTPLAMCGPGPVTAEAFGGSGATLSWSVCYPQSPCVQIGTGNPITFDRLLGMEQIVATWTNECGSASSSRFFPMFENPLPPFSFNYDVNADTWCDATFPIAVNPGPHGQAEWRFGSCNAPVFATGNLVEIPVPFVRRRVCVTSTNSCGTRCDCIFIGPFCDCRDFNNNGSLFDPQDIDAFLSVYSEGPCVPSTANCNDIDFNNDGSIFDPCDINSFLTVYSEGPCTSCGQ